MRFRRVLACSFTAAALAAGLVTPAAATDPLPTPGWPPVSDQPPTPPVVVLPGKAPVAVSGKLTNGGVGVSGDVVAYAWPNDEVLNALPEGGTFRLLPLVQTRSASNGQYELRIDPDAIPADYKSDTGQVDVDVVTANGTSQVTWSVSLLSLGKTGWAPASGQDVTVPTPVTLATDIARGTVAEAGVQYDDGTSHAAQVETQRRSPDLSADISHLARRAASASAVGTATPTATLAPTTICGPGSKSGTKNGISSRVLKAQGRANARVTVDFSTNASSTLGIAVSAGNGKWKMGGTKTISAGAGASNSWPSARAVYNKYNYAGYTSSGCSLTVTQWRPAGVHSFISSAPVVDQTVFPVANCTTYSSGTKWKDRGTNVTQKGGVQFPGVGLDAQTGWNSKVKMAWTFTGRAKLCGNSSSGWVSSSWAGARVA